MTSVEFLSEWPPNDDTSETNCSSETGDESEDDIASSDAIIASWWRKNKGNKRMKLTTSSNPKTILKAVKRLPGAKAVIKQEIEKALSQKSTPKRMFLLASLYYDLSEFKLAQDQCQKLIKKLEQEAVTSYNLKEYMKKLDSMTEFEKDVLWFHQKLSLQIASIQSASFSPNIELEVPIISSANLTIQQFKEQFCQRQTPVVITDLKVTDSEWTLDHIKEIAGNRKVTLKQSCSDSAEWAKLEPSKETTISSFVEEIKNKTSTDYLFDWSLPLFCPELNKEFVIPEYVKHDYLKRTSDGALYRNSWPSLFVTGAGNVSELHVDAFGSNFWMYLFSGRKKWTFFKPENLNQLKPNYYDSLDPVFDCKAEDGRGLSVSTVILEPGQFLFVPHGSPHRVENLTDSVAVSGNFVDESNIKDVLNHLKTNALVDPRAGELVKELMDLRLVTA